jgi:hypothetical protein
MRVNGHRAELSALTCREGVLTRMSGWSVAGGKATGQSEEGGKR